MVSHVDTIRANNPTLHIFLVAEFRPAREAVPKLPPAPRDLPGVAPVEDLESVLNSRAVHVPSFPTSARICEGVRETFNMIGSMVVQKSCDDGGLSSGGAPKPAPLNRFSPPVLSARAELPNKPD